MRYAVTRASPNRIKQKASLTMKTLKALTTVPVLFLLAQAPARAASGYMDTSRTYSSGLLIGLFLGFCALIVVVQLVPSLMMLAAFIKESLAKRKPRRQGVNVR